MDYRDLRGAEAFNKIASIGMVEHVGESRLPEYFGQAFRLLKPGGVFLNSGIGRPAWRHPGEGRSFSDVYMFPDGELVPIGEMLTVAEKAGFEIRALENLRHHCRLTLRCWVRRLEDHAEEAWQIVGRTNFRIWPLPGRFSALFQARPPRVIRKPAGQELVRRSTHDSGLRNGARPLLFAPPAARDVGVKNSSTDSRT